MGVGRYPRLNHLHFKCSTDYHTHKDNHHYIYYFKASSYCSTQLKCCFKIRFRHLQIQLNTHCQCRNYLIPPAAFVLNGYYFRMPQVRIALLAIFFITITAAAIIIAIITIIIIVVVVVAVAVAIITATITISLIALTAIISLVIRSAYFSTIYSIATSVS